MQRWAGEAQGSDLKTVNLQGSRYMFLPKVQHHVSDAGKPEGLFHIIYFALGKPKIVSFENLRYHFFLLQYYWIQAFQL